jgi:hypothetical protein
MSTTKQTALDNVRAAAVNVATVQRRRNASVENIREAQRAQNLAEIAALYAGASSTEVEDAAGEI